MKPMKAKDLITLLKNNGWVFDRSPPGSHVVYKKNGIHVTVPGTKNEVISPGTLRSILKTIKEVG